MVLPADFSKIFGSTATGGLTPISDVNYAKGWEYVGSNPPTKNDFSYLQNLSDQKSQWLYSNKLQRTNPFGEIKSDGASAVATAQSNLNLSDIVLAGVIGGVLGSSGHIDFPVIIGGVRRLAILQWGRIGYTTNPTNPTVQFPIAFPTACTCVVGMEIGQQTTAGGSVISAITPGPSKTGVTLTSRNIANGALASQADIMWFALGY